MRPWLALGSLALAALVLAGCDEIQSVGGQPAADETATATPPRGIPTLVPADALPAATLVGASGRALAIGKPGTRCWASLCADYIGPITALQPTSVSGGASLDMEFAYGTPDTVAYTWFRATDPPPTPTNGVLAWTDVFRDHDGSSESTLRIPTAPGAYVLVVFAAWHGDGDISYGFYLSID